MTKELTVFNFKSNPVRANLLDGNPWFCFKDVCGILDIKDRNQLKQRLNQRGVCLIPTPSGRGIQKTLFVNESNLYKAILRSDKKEAIEFENWICEEVLPAIRKTGQYVTTEIAVRPYKRKLPSVKKEIVLSETEHKAIGGIVKKCVAVAVKETLGSFLSPQEPLIAELKPNEKLTKAERKLAEAVVEFGQEKERHGKIKGMIEGAFNSQLSEIAKHVKPV